MRRLREQLQPEPTLATADVHRRRALAARPESGVIEPGASRALYDSLAPRFEEHFAVPHRRAYDGLAWDLIQPLLPPAQGRVVDIGCGVGRWARRLVDLGHSVVGIEPAPMMAAEAERRLNGTAFELVERPVEEVDLPQASADVVLAMESLQYTADPAEVLRRVRGWLRPGGAAAVLVDSLVALVLELLEIGRDKEALVRLRIRKATWVQNGVHADYHIFDAHGVGNLLEQAGFRDVHVRGLLVGWSVHGRNGMLRRLDGQWPTQLAMERRLDEEKVLADAGKQLIGIGRVPRGSACIEDAEATR